MTRGMSRRAALASLFGPTLAPALVGTLTPNWSGGAVAAPAAAPFTLPPLPYAPTACEAAVDAETMMLHHDKHHAAYVNNLNAAIAKHPELAGRSLPALLADLESVPQDVRSVVRNNAGGHANHTMFWEVMGGAGGDPAGDLRAAIDRDLGGVAAMKAAFEKAGMGVFGSGWVFVTVSRDGRLALATSPNQDTPLMQGGRVLFGNDCWEHAYYLRYRNRRAEYLAAWWKVVNWDKVAARYQAARAGTLQV